MRVRYSPRAFADREGIFAYLDKRSAQGARTVKRAIVRAIRLLASHPQMAPPTDEAGVRELSVPRRPYKVYYRVDSWTEVIVDSKLNGTSRRIRALNDAFRQSFNGGQVYLTSGVAALEPTRKAQVLEAVRTFRDFDEGNDPHGEHDFASIEVDGENYFFKIDYYDTDIRYLSDDPSDPAITKRIMTIMLASEY